MKYKYSVDALRPHLENSFPGYKGHEITGDAVRVNFYDRSTTMTLSRRGIERAIDNFR